MCLRDDLFDQLDVALEAAQHPSFFDEERILEHFPETLDSLNQDRLVALLATDYWRRLARGENHVSPEDYREYYPSCGGLVVRTIQERVFRHNHPSFDPSWMNRISDPHELVLRSRPQWKRTGDRSDNLVYLECLALNPHAQVYLAAELGQPGEIGH